MFWRVSPSTKPGPPQVLGLAGHELRWRLLTELVRSDRQVRELTERLSQPQSLVSYHLGRLRAAGLVASRRSSADRRGARNLIGVVCMQEVFLHATAPPATRLGTFPPRAPGFVRGARW